jgi:ribosomal-protein-alanine N-acetyltransferase
MQPNIRIGTIDDASDLAAIRAACFDTAWPVESFATMLANPNYSCLLIPNVAYALVQKISPEAELISIAVVPDARRRGIAEKLLRQIWQSLQSDGIDTLHLEVNEQLTEARALYQKTGFESVGRRAQYYQKPDKIAEDAILMRLQTQL